MGCAWEARPLASFEEGGSHSASFTVGDLGVTGNARRGDQFTQPVNTQTYFLYFLYLGTLPSVVLRMLYFHQKTVITASLPPK